MFLRGEYWHYDFIVRGERYRGSTGFKKNEKVKAAEIEEKLKVQAREGHSLEMIWEQTKRRMVAGREIDMNFNTLWDAFVKKSSSRAAPKRLRIYASEFRVFCDWMKEHHPDVKKVSGVLPIHAQEYISEIRAGLGSNSTKNDYLSSAKMIFSSLGKDYGIIENPFDGIKKLPPNQITREAFTREEIAAMGKNAKGWMKSLCFVAEETGLREGDVCMLLKSSIDLNTGWIYIPKTRKTGATVDMPLSPALQKHLSEAIQNSDNEYVFPELAKIYTENQTKIGKEVKAFFDEIGISGATKKPDGYKRALSMKDIHSFRHTFAYKAAESGIPLPVVQKEMGHTNSEMTKHYMDHAGREAKSRYFQQMPDYFSNSNAAPKKELTAERILRLLSRLTQDNLERNKARITALLQR